MSEKMFGTRVDDVDSTIINITRDSEDFAWFLSDIVTDKQVEKVVDKLNELAEENEQLTDYVIGKISFAKMGGFSMVRDDRGNFNIYSENVIPKDSPIVSIKSPAVFWNDIIAKAVWRIIERTGGLE